MEEDPGKTYPAADPENIKKEKKKAKDVYEKEYPTGEVRYPPYGSMMPFGGK